MKSFKDHDDLRSLLEEQKGSIRTINRLEEELLQQNQSEELRQELIAAISCENQKLKTIRRKMLRKVGR